MEGGITRTRSPPSFIPAMPTSHPLITSPSPMVNSNYPRYKKKQPELDSSTHWFAFLVVVKYGTIVQLSRVPHAHCAALRSLRPTPNLTILDLDTSCNLLDALATIFTNASLIGLFCLFLLLFLLVFLLLPFRLCPVSLFRRVLRDDRNSFARLSFEFL